MPVQNARVIEMPVRGNARGDVQGNAHGDATGDVQFEGREAPVTRPAAVDAVAWGATLLAQLGFDPRKRPAA
jgi:hypothetical protein